MVFRNELNVEKFYETLFKILSDKHGVEIKYTIRKKETDNKDLTE